MKLVQIGYIQESSETKTRDLDPERVGEYAERMLAGVKFPPVYCRYDGKRYWLWDGHHRLAAARQAKRKEIDVMSEPGGLTEAIYDSTSANKANGLPRNTKQKQEAVIRALRYQATLPKRASNRDIAAHVGVSPGMIDLWQAKLERGELDEDKVTSEMEPASSAGQQNELPKLGTNNLSAEVGDLPSETRTVMEVGNKSSRLPKIGKLAPTLEQQLDRALKQLRLILLAMGDRAPAALSAVVSATSSEQLPNIGNPTTIVVEESQATDPM